MCFFLQRPCRPYLPVFPFVSSLMTACGLIADALVGAMKVSEPNMHPNELSTTHIKLELRFKSMSRLHLK